MATQIFLWWLVVQALGLAGLPLTGLLFRALPDRGYAFSKVLGLLLTGYLAWLIAMLGLAPFGSGLLVVCALLVGGAGLLATRPRASGALGAASASLGITATPAQPSVPRFAIRDSAIPWLREHWRMVLGYEALFALALIFLALLRSYQPDPWGTERPMDYALFNAIRHSATFPPHDPWLSGYSINYYYFGYLLMAAVALISGLEPAVAYNLSLALIFALVALGAAGIVSNLIALTQNREPRTKNQEPGTENLEPRTENQEPRVENRVIPRTQKRRERSRILAPGPWLAALFAAVLVLFCANQGGALQVITGADMAVALDAPTLARAVVNGLGPRAPLSINPPFKGDYFDGTSTITPTDTVTNFNWWYPSRAIWDDYSSRGDPTHHYAITEFPFFSFWLGDMHPHVMALPFGLLVLALALQMLARPTAPAFGLGRRGWLELALTGVVLGSLYLINSWDFPTYLLLFLGALLILYVRLGAGNAAPGATPTERLAGVWWRHYAGQAAMALLAALALFAPFYLTFHSLVGGREPATNLPILASITRIIGFFSWTKTPLHSFLIIFGLFLTPLVVYVFAQGRRQADKQTRRQGDTETRRQGDKETRSQESGVRSQESGVRSQESGVRSQESDVGESTTQNSKLNTQNFSPIPNRQSAALSPQSSVLSPPVYLPWVTLAALVVGLLVGFPLLALLPLALYASALALERAERPATAFALWLFALGCLICFGTEIIYIRDVFEGSGTRMNTIFKFYYQVWLIWGMLASYALWWLYTHVFSARRLGGYLFGALFALLLAGSLVYPWLTAGKSFREGQRVGLAGTTPREQTPDGAAAIAWLRANTPEDAIVLEAVGGAYNVEGFGAVSASSGRATVLGWPGHEQQWRGGDPGALAQIEPRKADVETIYNTTDVGQARALLAKYKVSYIYDGPLERSTYTPEGLAKLAQLGTIVFQQGEVTIYQVKG